MEKYLIAIDLDGTLLKDWATVSQKTIEYLREIQTKGHQIVLATGRPFRSSEKFYDLLGLTTPLINYNGGLVTSKNDPLFKGYSLTVDKKAILDIFETNKKYIHNAFGEVKDDIYLLEDTEEIQPLIHNFNGAKLTVGDFSETLTEPTNGFIIIANKGEGHHIEEYVKKHYSEKVLFRNWGNEYRFIIELFSPMTNKGRALKYVSEYLGFTPEQTIVFGDAHNDIEMLQFGGRSVAMKNAQDCLFEYADEVTEFKNHEDGVIEHLKTIIK